MSEVRVGSSDDLVTVADELCRMLDERGRTEHDGVGSSKVRAGSSITDELREWKGNINTRLQPETVLALRSELNCIADRIDAEHERAMREEYQRGANDSYDMGFASADDWLAQHEDAMAEHGWVKGPLDADGKMWRSGDISDSNWGEIEGIAYEDGRWLISGHDTSAPWVPADSIRHYHAPTVEDVLTKMLEQAVGYSDAHTTVAASTVAEYAAKLRLAEEVDE